MGTSDKLINENERRQFCSRANWNYIFFSSDCQFTQKRFVDLFFLIDVLLMTIGGTDLFVVRRAVASPCITHRFLGKQISATLIILSSLCTSLFIATHSDQPSVDYRKKKCKSLKKPYTRQ